MLAGGGGSGSQRGSGDSGDQGKRKQGASFSHEDNLKTLDESAGQDAYPAAATAYTLILRDCNRLRNTLGCGFRGRSGILFPILHLDDPSRLMRRQFTMHPRSVAPVRASGAVPDVNDAYSLPFVIDSIDDSIHVRPSPIEQLAETSAFAGYRGTARHKGE